MLTLIQHHLITLLVALTIGLVTAWWAYGRRPVASDPNKPEDEKPS